MDKYITRTKVRPDNGGESNVLDGSIDNQKNERSNSRESDVHSDVAVLGRANHDLSERPNTDFSRASTSHLKEQTERLEKPKKSKIEKWKKDYPWIKYDENKNVIFCQICTEAVFKGLLLPENSAALSSKKAFVEDGFKTFKNAPTAFRPHDVSEFHQTAMVQVPLSKSMNIMVNISDANKKQMLKNRIALEAIFSSILFLCKQGLAIRGHEDEKSNLYQLLKTRSEEIPELKAWLNRENHRWLHSSIVNEIMNLIATSIQNRNLDQIRSNGDYGLLLDGTTDVSKLEQECLCIRSVNEDFSVEEFFIEFVNAKDTKSDTLLGIITERVETSNLRIRRCRGQCYDGASNMSGRISGLQTQVRALERRALYVHCSAHCLNLCVQDALEDISQVRNVIGIMKDMINFVRDSWKRLQDFKSIQDEGSSNLVAFCPTRFTVRIKSLKSVYDNNYASTIEFCESKMNDRNVDALVSAKARGFLRSLLSFDFYFIISVIIIVFDQVEILNTELQKKELCVNESHASVNVVSSNISRMRDETVFSKIWNDVVATSAALGVEKPVVPRQTNAPKRYEPTLRNTAHTYSNPEEYFRQTYYEIIETTVNSLDDRFQSETMSLLNQFEDFLVGKRADASIIVDFYNSEDDNEQDPKFDVKGLERERDLLLLTMVQDEAYQRELSSAPPQKKRKTADAKYLDCPSRGDSREIHFKDILNYLRSRPNVKIVFRQITRLIRLILTVPGSSCTTERSFSVLRRIKNYSRSTMSQERLNSASTLFIYSELAENGDLDSWVNDFIRVNKYRMQTFAIKK